MSRWLTFVCLLTLVSGCAAYATHQFDSVFGEQNTTNRVVAVSNEDAAFYNDQVKPILDSRCVSCHAVMTPPVS
ncbi:hypothetical protein N5P32_11345 [Marinomonas pontica]|uniref:hypothetical protein n=1 Tax=Marinomonas pontica TaxID=264739 RepID=UPI002243A69B|nr:hypothetical protein [Marinomonas pontica]MCW8356463.1 hypothetical protein [Marinomonas pontica]